MIRWTLEKAKVLLVSKKIPDASKYLTLINPSKCMTIFHLQFEATYSHRLADNLDILMLTRSPNPVKLIKYTPPLLGPV